jgi:hypothetical protein
LGALKNDFLSGFWHFPFDIFEAIFETSEDLMGDPDEVASRIRNALERENQAYTFVGGRFVERMTVQEVESVETALKHRSKQSANTSKPRCSCSATGTTLITETVPRREILTSSQRMQLLAFPDDEGELIRRCTLTKADLAFVRQHRGNHNQPAYG